MVTRRRLQRELDTGRIRRAIEQAERRTSAEIRVSLSPFFVGDVLPVARSAMARLGMTATRARNGVLIFVVPSRRRFAIWGDAGIHERVGQELWDEIAASLGAAFAAGSFTEGLVAAVGLLGERLARHFPYEAARDANELPDEVDLPA